jgi:pilus assembly protein Flp/PilA
MRQNQRGATAIEYGLIAALIFLAIVPGMQMLSGNNGGLFGDIANKVVAATAHVR